MPRGTAVAHRPGPPREIPRSGAEARPLDAGFGVTGPYADRVDDARRFAVTSRIGSIVRTDRNADRAAAVRGAAQIRRDLATVAAGLDRPR